jgi:hypothetical protein
MSRNCLLLGFTVDRSEIVEALAGLIADGLASAYLLSGYGPSRKLDGMPPLEVVEEDFTTYFYITKKGLDFHLSDDTFPFNDDGQPQRE